MKIILTSFPNKLGYLISNKSPICGIIPLAYERGWGSLMKGHNWPIKANEILVIQRKHN